MAAIVDESCDLDLTSLAAGVKKSLPSYARPVFVRILQKVEMTGKVNNSYSTSQSNPSFMGNFWFFNFES